MSTASVKPIRLARVEICRFRRLQSVRLDLERDTTVLVGANNSGKTAVIAALRLFLRDRSEFRAYDIGADRWKVLRDLGTIWESLKENPSENCSVELTMSWQDQLQLINDSMPMMDAWFNVDDGGYHYVSHILPSLDWRGGLIGIRLRLEPAASVKELQKLAWSYSRARELAKAAVQKDSTAVSRAWPTDLLDYWLRYPEQLGKVASYKLDPEKIEDVTEKYRAQPQQLRPDAVRSDQDLLKRVIRIDLIPAQRGLGTNEGDGRVERDGPPQGLFSRQLVKLAERRFDREPYDREAQSAMQAAIARAQVGLDEALDSALEDITKTVHPLGFPGLHDPQKLRFRSRLRSSDVLNHGTAVQYLLESTSDAPILLPENSIGLGYQNLQTLKYRLFSFREERLGALNEEPGDAPEPVHLVLVEEPEAHLHVQAQRVFINRAYDLLEADEYEPSLSSQLLVSTHSSHVAHSVSFAKLRYLRRESPAESAEVPGSVVIWLHDVFGSDKETQRFAERYLRIQHSDLLFADAAVFVEGTAERLLVPHFVERDCSNLASRYLSYLEVGGSHAHRVLPLIERLGIPVLVITDIDPGSKAGESKKYVKAPLNTNELQVTLNPTLSRWPLGEGVVSELLKLRSESKVRPMKSWPSVGVRVAYQVAGAENMPCGTTFEDAFVLENTAFFMDKSIGNRTGPMKLMQTAVEKHSGDAAGLANELHDILSKSFDKAQFALDVLSAMREDISVRCPKYIKEGLDWLDEQLSPITYQPPPLKGVRAA